MDRNIYSIGELVRWYTYSMEMIITDSGIGPIVEIQYHKEAPETYGILKENGIVYYTQWEIEKCEEWVDEL